MAGEGKRRRGEYRHRRHHRPATQTKRKRHTLGRHPAIRTSLRTAEEESDRAGW